MIPLAASGEYEIIVITDVTDMINDRLRDNNKLARTLNVNLAPYADLNISSVSAPAVPIINDPAYLDVSWTVTNKGTGAANSQSWIDQVILSKDDTIGNVTI